METRELIENFYDGCTTAAEENELRRRLCNEPLPADIEREKELLLAMLPAAEAAPAQLAERLSQLIDAASEREEKSRRKRVRLYTWSSSVAAAAVLLLCLFAPTTQQPRDTFSTPEEAAVHINEAFAHLASIIGRGAESQREVAGHLNIIGAATGNSIHSIVKFQE